MAQVAGKDHTYATAGQFLERCLRRDGSLLWPNASAWSRAALEELWRGVVESPDLSERSFYEKLNDQLEGLSRESLRIAADIMAFYFLFPNSTSSVKKRERVGQILSISASTSDAQLVSLWRAYEEGGIGNPGAYYNTGLPWMFAYMTALGLEAKHGAHDLSQRDGLIACADAAVVRAQTATRRNTRTMRHVALHLMDPDQFERITSESHKEAVLSHYKDIAPNAGSLDERLLGLRHRLMEERQLSELDFYADDIFAEWSPNAPSSDDIVPTPSSSLTMPKVFIEKSLVDSREDRKSGPHALGKALWSPQQSKSGTDIYRFMRDVSPGDVVLHLTDNFGFTGISIADSSVDTSFQGVPGTAWANQSGYRIALKDFKVLDPPLTKAELFEKPWVDDLLDLLNKGLRHTFYSREPSLNQGHYLTPAPPELVSVLNKAYRAKTGRALLPLLEDHEMTRTEPTTPVIPSPLREACSSFASALDASGIRFGGRHQALVTSFFASILTKRFAILSGLSGSGKTQLAVKFGQWLGAGRYLVTPVRPDWTGPDALLGFEDALQPAAGGRKSWVVPPVLEFILRAAGDATEPYLLVLDEMNLAHVERYFADVLSGIESDEPCVPNLERESDGNWRVREGASRVLPLPRNLIIVGTVNVDETTYMFSPKVLDRANTFEFRVLSDELFLPSGVQRSINSSTPEVRAQVLRASQTMQSAHIESDSSGSSLGGLLRSLHELLFSFGFEFGHRTFIESNRFAGLLSECGTTGTLQALDLVLMQKILPRIHGSRREIEPLLTRLLQFCVSPHVAIEDASIETPSEIDPALGLPISADKVARMLRLLKANQYVSFTS